MVYVVVRTHSHTDKQQLWKVMSRAFKEKDLAEDWKEFCESQEKNPNHEFFVVSLEKWW